MELVQQPDLSQVRNVVFKKVIRGLQSEQSIDTIASHILSELSGSMVMMVEKEERKNFIREMYNAIQSAHKIRQFNYGHESQIKNQIASKTIDEISFRFRIRYSSYF